MFSRFNADITIRISPLNLGIYAEKKKKEMNFHGKTTLLIMFCIFPQFF